MFLMINENHLIKLSDILEVKKSDLAEIEHKYYGNGVCQFGRLQESNIDFKYVIEGKIIENSIKWYDNKQKERDFIFDEIVKELSSLRKVDMK